jgi:hypothetical protein
LMRGNLGERLATEALAAMGHQILGYKPDISGTSRPGIDIVTLHNGQVWLIDNKAYSRGGTIRGASALTRNFRRNLAQVRGQVASMAFDPQRPPGEHRMLQQALQHLNTGHYVRRPDRGGGSYWNFPRAAIHAFSPSAQRSHALRRTPSTSQAAALSEIRRHLATLYLLALRAPNRATALGWIGEAVHLIQDSYSGAHTERSLGRGAGGASPIRRIRAFYLSLWPPRRSTAPHEHNVPSDPRDRIWKSPGVLTNEARFAIRASREYLTMMLRHVRYPSAPGNLAEFRTFLRRHFRF